MYRYPYAYLFVTNVETGSLFREMQETKGEISKTNDFHEATKDSNIVEVKETSQDKGSPQVDESSYLSLSQVRIRERIHDSSPLP